MTDLKDKYNFNLQRIEKAFNYFDREDIPLQVKEKQINNFIKLIEEQNRLIDVLGLKSGDIEIMNGFSKATA